MFAEARWGLALAHAMVRHDREGVSGSTNFVRPFMGIFWAVSSVFILLPDIQKAAVTAMQRENERERGSERDRESERDRAQQSRLWKERARGTEGQSEGQSESKSHA